MSEREIRHAYSPRIRDAVDFTGQESRTKQSEAPETDINAIVRKYQETGQMSHLNMRAPMVGDFTMAQDLHSALNLVHEANDHFMQLSPEVRRVANNDPVQFLSLLASEEGTKRLTDAGLNANFDRGGNDAASTEEATNDERPVEGDANNSSSGGSSE